MIPEIEFSKYHKEALEKTELFVDLKLGVHRKDLYSNKKTQAVTNGRFMAYYILSRVFLFPNSLIAQIYDKTYSTIVSGINKVISLEWNQEIVRQFKDQYPSIKYKQINNKLSTDCKI